MLPMIILNIILIISIIWLCQLIDINTITQPKLNNTQFNITQFNNEQFIIHPIINDKYPYPIHVLDLMVYRI
jgi:hypothetical protein